jgi:hypothetical protein
MTILLPTLAIAFAASCVWLTVRVVNRRERWAKWTLAAVAAVSVLYVGSFGPVRYAYWKLRGPRWMQDMAVVLFEPHYLIHQHGPRWLSNAISAYDDWWFRPPPTQ